jgi:hypothetical protein
MNDGSTTLCDITHEWLRLHRDCVMWDAPLYNHGQCWQLAIVQALNTAGRKEKGKWFLLVRKTPQCREYTGVPESSTTLHLSPTVYPSREVALVERRKAYEELPREWTRTSPCFAAFKLSPEHNSQWRIGEDESRSIEALRQHHTICVHAVMPCATDIVYVWIEANTDYLQVYRVKSGLFIDESDLCGDESYKRLHAYLTNIMTDRPHVFLVGFFHQRREAGTCMLTMYVYDAIAFPAYPVRQDVSALPPAIARRVDFATQPLVARLMHLEAIIKRERRDFYGDCVTLAPFQQAFTKKDLRLHTSIFIDSCGFSGVIRRIDAGNDAGNDALGSTQ